MDNIKVAFFISTDRDWLGGLNYYRSLIMILHEYREFGIQPVAVVLKEKDQIIRNEFSEVLMLHFDYDRVSKPNERIVRLEEFLLRENIAAISHIQGDFCRLRLPKIAWIPDFQHKYLPTLFTRQEIEQRDSDFFNISDHCQRVIVSSQQAKSDFCKFLPSYQGKVDVLQFVVPVKNQMDAAQIEEIKKKYCIASNYFYMPNQFWAHKNHIVVLRALKLLKERNRDVLVVSTGNQSDYRNQGHMRDLESYIEEYRLERNFKRLGIVPYQDVQLLTRGCLAMINPSLFEGWSTTVEEAKSIGKRILLSDIPVHREQNPPGGIYFDSHDANELSEHIWKIWNSDFDEQAMQNNAKQDLQKRKYMLAKRYREIVDKAISEFEKNEFI